MYVGVKGCILTQVAQTFQLKNMPLESVKKLHLLPLQL